MGVFENISIPGHEMVNFFQDESVGLKSIIAVHNSTLGPTCGGLRIWPYESEEAALQDETGKSKVIGTYFYLNNGSASVQCFIFTKESNIKSGLDVAIRNTEYTKWLESLHD